MSQRSLLRSGQDLLARLDERVRTLERKRATLTSDVVNTVAVPGPPGPAGAPGAPGANGATGATGPAGPAATIEALEEGVSLGTFDTVDFVGAAITATMVGTDLTVTVSSSASVLDDPRWRMMVAM